MRVTLTVTLGKTPTCSSPTCILIKFEILLVIVVDKCLLLLYRKFVTSVKNFFINNNNSKLSLKLFYMRFSLF